MGDAIAIGARRSRSGARRYRQPVHVRESTTTAATTTGVSSCGITSSVREFVTLLGPSPSTSGHRRRQLSKPVGMSIVASVSLAQGSDCADRCQGRVLEAHRSRRRQSYSRQVQFRVFAGPRAGSSAVRIGVTLVSHGVMLKTSGRLVRPFSLTVASTSGPPSNVARQVDEQRLVHRR